MYCSTVNLCPNSTYNDVQYYPAVQYTAGTVAKLTDLPVTGTSTAANTVGISDLLLGEPA